MVNIEKKLFGKYEGQDVYKYEIKNKGGFQVNVLNLGCIITEIYTRDRDGIGRNVVLGYEKLEDYLDNAAYPGAVIGRTAGRIENGSFSIDGISYELEKNNGKNSIHGGRKGLNTRIFQVKEIGNGIEFSYRSPHMEEGYPGNVDFKVAYLINENDILTVNYSAISDRRTYVNMTNHTYFNLSGDMQEKGYSQHLCIQADRVCELGEGLIPTGKLIDVTGTVFDLREGKIIKEGIEEGHEQFRITRAYDHPFVLNWKGIQENPQIILYSDHSGIEMSVFTTERTAVVYTGNYLDDVKPFNNVCVDDKGNIKDGRYMGVAIETQDFPNGINEESSKAEILEKNQEYRQKTVFKFRNRGNL